jgi:hypothetical protein
MHIHLRWALPLVASGAFLVSVNCADSLDPFEPEIANATDNFQLQATGVTSTTLDRTYT